MSRYDKNRQKVETLVKEVSQTHPLTLKNLDNYNNYRQPLTFRYQYNKVSPPINITFTINDQSIDEFSINIYVNEGGIECWAIQKFDDWNFNIWKNNELIELKQSSNTTHTITTILDWMVQQYDS